MMALVRAGSVSLLAATSIIIPFAGVRSAVALVPVSTLCDVSPVHTGVYPGWRDGPRLTWIETKNKKIAGLLFFAAGKTGNDALLHPHGTMGDGRTTKILWYIKARAGRNLVLKGADVYGTAMTQQSFPRASSPAGNYPSIVDVPSAGCWRFDLKSGKVQGRVIMQAVDTGA